MQLSEQVITLEQARKLKALWFDKHSLWKIEDEYETIYQVWRDYKRDWYRANDDTSDWWEWYNAYTVSELMDILPAYLSPFELFIKKQLDDTYKVWYIRWYWENENDKSYESSYIIDNKNLVYALWNMLIYLIENDLLPVDKTNE